MKKIILLLVLLLALPLAAQADDFIFGKGLEWGMSQKEVWKKVKGKGVKELDKTDTTLVVRMPFKEHKNAEVTFAFADKQLNGAECIIKYITVISNAEIYQQDYAALVADFTAVYGKPKENQNNWLITDQNLLDTFKQKPGLAVSMGYLEMLAKWDDANTGMHVEVSLYSPENMKAAIKIVYAPL